jgi:EAL domain-containing protein (putative c-di-GMP-specific phosphodiesterase class I)
MKNSYPTRHNTDIQEGGLAVVPVSVNVSSVQFVESDLQRVVSDALKRHGVDPRHLELELTESLLLDDSTNVEEILADLRAIGVRIALDDFGTGYSALTYLNRFRLDVLKMDRGLVRDIDSDPSALGIVKAVVSMAHSLGLSVVAEGVDSGLQVPILQDVECDQIQGFLYAPALPADEAVRYMSPQGQPRVRLSEQGSSPGNRAVETPAAPVAAAIDALDDTPATRAPEGGALVAPESDAPAASASPAAIGQVALTRRALPVEDDGAGAYASVPRTAAPGGAVHPGETPVLAQATAPGPARGRKAIGQVLLVDDARQSLSTVVMRLLHLGLDVHYASAADEAALYIGQEGAAIRVVAFAPTIDVAECQRIHGHLVQATGEPRSWIVIGERPDEPARRALREAGVDWVLWSPFNDAELRYLVKSAMARHDELVDRREVRVPVELVASIWSGSRREMAVVSSLSARGAFIELSEPLALRSSLRIQMELGPDTVRGFARVVRVQPPDPERPGEPSGVGVTFYGLGRDEERLLRKAISELRLRYQP